MITREMIQKGFQTGSISIEDELAGCIGLCCRIEDNAFYFAGMEDEDLTAKEYLESHTTDEIIDMIFNVLKDQKTAEENGIYEEEWLFYKAVLDD